MNRGHKDMLIAPLDWKPLTAQRQVKGSSLTLQVYSRNKVVELLISADMDGLPSQHLIRIYNEDYPNCTKLLNMVSYYI
jgi:hypothetical protein